MTDPRRSVQDLDNYNLHPVIQDTAERGLPIPQMPDAWISRALVNPYYDDEIRAVRTVCVHSKAQMFHQSYGVDETAFSLFFKDGDLYLMPHDRTTAPIGPIGMDVSVPGRNMFAVHGLLNQGSGFLYNQPVNFYLGYSPEANGYKGNTPPTAMQTCNWVWAKKTQKLECLPLRWFFTNANNPCGIPYLGLFALATFENFESSDAVDQLDWASDLCKSADAASASLISALQNAKDTKAFHGAIVDNLKNRPEFWQGSSEQPGQIITGLGPADKGTGEPEWDKRIKMTGFTYQTSKHDPSEGLGDAAMPLRVYYDWPSTGLQDAHMLTHLSLNQHEWFDADHMDIFLDAKGNDTFVTFQDGHTKFEGHDATGIVKYNWAAMDHGAAKASLRNNPLICPGEVLNITTLPNDDRHFWVWYTPENKGVLFMEIPQKADVLLVLTDYYTYDMDPPAFLKDWWMEPPKTQSS